MRSSFIVTATAALLAAGGASAQTFIGQSFSGGYFLPDRNTPYDQGTSTPPSFVVGAGLEQSVDIEGVTQFLIDFDASSLVIDFETVLNNPRLNDADFSGLVFQSPTALPFANVSLGAGTNLAGFDLSRVTLAPGNRIELNFEGLAYTSDTVVELTFAGVPEASTWAMMIAGFGLVGVTARRRRGVIAAA